MKLTVGAYRNEAGKPWVLPVVKKVRSANLVAISTSFGDWGRGGLLLVIFFQTACTIIELRDLFESKSSYHKNKII